MSREKTYVTHNQRILRILLGEGKVAWFLFTQNRKLIQCAGSDGNQLCTDEMAIDVTTLGAFDGKIRAGDKVMEMAGNASSITRTVDFSNGYIVVEEPWKSLRIGTYMMNCLVTWATEHYADFAPIGIKLHSNQARGDNKERRNRFYARFGFKFEWVDNNQEEAVLASGLHVRDLNTTHKWQEKVNELSIVEGLKDIFSESQRIQLSKATAERSQFIAFNERDSAKTAFQLSEARKTRWGLGGFALGAIVAMTIALWVVSH